MVAVQFLDFCISIYFAGLFLYAYCGKTIKKDPSRVKHYYLFKLVFPSNPQRLDWVENEHS
jgi:hypothetical protein